MIAIDEYYRVNGPPDSQVMQVYLAAFSHRRHVVTWPVTALLLHRIGYMLLRGRNPGPDHSR